MYDNDGQPLNSRLNSRLRTEREIDELIGLSKGVLADGSVNQAEAEFLIRWLALNRETTDRWPANVLIDRLTAMLKDGRLDKNEERELLALLMDVTGGDASRLSAHSLSAGLPINNPIPAIVIPGKRFCFTGKFVFGARNKCQMEIEKRSGFVIEGVNSDLDFLVVGVIGSRDWKHSSFGRKIERAVEYREKGHSLAIIAEEHFLGALARHSSGGII
jgi:NAD-dependent DNA ligase